MNKNEQVNSQDHLPPVDHRLWGALLPVLHPDNHGVRVDHAGGAGVLPSVGHGDRVDGEHGVERAACEGRHLDTHTRDGVVVDHPGVMEPGHTIIEGVSQSKAN